MMIDNYYSLLGVDAHATQEEIKSAFREQAKRLHPDIAGEDTSGAMRRLLAAYEALSNKERRFEYDRAYTRFANQFDYPTFLRERRNDPESQAKLVFYLLLHPGNQAFDPLEVWEENGGLDFRMEHYLEREDWMDCGFLLAEELDRRDRVAEAFALMTSIMKEEKRKPYFRHFMEDVDGFSKRLERKLGQKEKTVLKKGAERVR
jgi:curved DNA-binding protein CbpA